MRHRYICKLWLRPHNAMTTFFVNNVKNEPAHTLWIPLHLLFWLCPSSGECFLLPGCILAWGWRSAARWLRLFACSQYYRVSNICHLRHLWRTKPHKTGFIGWARHCCCASLRTCSHLSSIFDSPIFLMVIDTPYNHSFDDLSMSTTRSWMFANHIYLRAGKLISPFTNSSSFVAKRGPGAWFCNWARLVVHNCARGR